MGFGISAPQYQSDMKVSMLGATPREMVVWRQQEISLRHEVKAKVSDLSSTPGFARVGKRIKH